MENQDRIAHLENRIEELSRNLIAYHSQIIQLKNEVRSLKNPESVEQIVSPPIENRPIPQLKPFVKPTKSINSEEFLGGNVLSKVGIVILVIGIGIFVKYAIDNNLLNPAARIVLGYISGISLGVLAYFTKPKFHAYSSVLVSGAMATLYFTTYSAYHFYHFYSLGLTFGLMVIFTIATVYLAMIYEREWIGIFGLVGAYAVPFLLSNNSGEVWKLFSYMTLINLGILWLMNRKNWYWMGGVAFFFTWVIFIFARTYNYDEPQNIWINLGFSTIFLLIPIYYWLIRSAKNQHLSALGTIALVAGSFCYYLSNIDIFTSISNGQFEALFTFLFALFNVGLAYYLFKKSPSNTPFIWFTGISAMLLFYLASYLQIGHWYEANRPSYGNTNYDIHQSFENIWLLNYTMAFLSVLIWIALKYNFKKDFLIILMFISGLIILSAIAISGASDLRMEYMKSNLPFVGLGIRYIQYLFIGILIYLNLRLAENLSDNLKFFKNIRYLTLALSILLILSYETTTLWMFFDKSKAEIQADNSTRVGYSVLWAIFGLAMIYIGFIKRSQLFRISGIVLLGIVILKLFFYDLIDASTISKIILFISIGVLLLIASFLYQKLSKRLLEEE